MKVYQRITLRYAVFGILWILLTDQVVAHFIHDSATVTFFQTIKGALYVTVSTALIYVLTKRAFMREQAEEAERRAVFTQTAKGSYHVLLIT